MSRYTKTALSQASFEKTESRPQGKKFSSVNYYHSEQTRCARSARRKCRWRRSDRMPNRNQVASANARRSPVRVATARIKIMAQVARVAPSSTSSEYMRRGRRYFIYRATTPKEARKHRTSALVRGWLACGGGGATPNPNAKLTATPTIGLKRAPARLRARRSAD